MNLNTLKKSCNRCFAGKHEHCELGFKASWMAYDEYGFTKFGVPQEPCPKPLTISDLIFARKWYKKKSYYEN